MRTTGSRIRGALDTSLSSSSPTNLATSSDHLPESRSSLRIAELEAKIETDTSMISTLRTFLEQGRVERDNLYNAQEAAKAKIQTLEKQLAEAIAALSIKPKEVIIEVPVKNLKDDTEAQLAIQTKIAADAERRLKNMEMRCQSMEKDLDESRTSCRLLQTDLGQITEKLKHSQTEKEAVATQLKVQKKTVADLKERVKDLIETGKAAKSSAGKVEATRSAARVTSQIVSAETKMPRDPSPSVPPIIGPDLGTTAALERLSSLLVSTQDKLSANEELLAKSNVANLRLQSEVADLMRSALRPKTNNIATSPTSAPPSPTVSLKNLEISTLKEELSRMAIDLDRQRGHFEEKESELEDSIYALNLKLNPARSEFGTQSESVARYSSEIQTEPTRQPLSELKIIRRLKPLLDCPGCGASGGKIVTLLPCSHHLCEKCHEKGLKKDKLLEGCECLVCGLKAVYALPSKAIEKLSAVVKAVERDA